MGSAGKKWDVLGRNGMSWEEVGCAGKEWDELGRCGMCWEEVG